MEADPIWNMNAFWWLTDVIYSFNKQKKFYICDLDLKVSEGVGGLGMIQNKSLDQYLTSGKVSTRSS